MWHVLGLLNLGQDHAPSGRRVPQDSPGGRARVDRVTR
ncbi:hypothetical protein D187_004932 [Cystobacter fuscus DSM 2262]|uniref:Uncharacterized protein n=1 Tax=Cystobacter fuscus (strain ATCC 25194 / DSM 2262 / NBRC 100088 / M29) TaxID=1242864 RepID=S9R4H9_CYSF2|nr:hypothetical protein D187_004932 [Cystobacter fuscus DSM 2262]